MSYNLPNYREQGSKRWILDSDGELVVKGTNSFGNKDIGNYSEFESDGHLEFVGNATCWIDIDFPQIIRTTGTNTPSIATLQGNITMAQWAINDYNNCEVGEFIHSWKEGSQAVWHIHFFTGGSDTNDRYLNFEIEYTWANFNTTLPANTIVTSGDILIPANTPAKHHLIANVNIWTPTGGKIGAHIKPRLKRVASSGTAPTANPFLEMLQLHIECDGVGSRAMITK